MPERPSVERPHSRREREAGPPAARVQRTVALQQPQSAYLCPSAAEHHSQPVPDGGEHRGKVGQAEQDPEPHQRLVGWRVLSGVGAWNTPREEGKKLIWGQACEPWFTAGLHCLASKLLERACPPQVKGTVLDRVCDCVQEDHRAQVEGMQGSSMQKGLISCKIMTWARCAFRMCEHAWDPHMQECHCAC